jgi:hypothetical protein
MGQHDTKPQLPWGELQTLNLRALIAAYFFSVAIGFFTMPGADVLARALVPAPVAPGLMTVFLTAMGWMVLRGRGLRGAMLGLMGFVVGSRLGAPEASVTQIVLHDGLLLAAMAVGAGWLLPLHERRAAQRIGLEHRPVARSVRFPAAHHSASTRAAFSQSPDELAALFDELREVPRI